MAKVDIEAYTSHFSGCAALGDLTPDKCDCGLDSELALLKLLEPYTGDAGDETDAG